ncbi:MAG: sigma-54-dependent Fis family transcriptional regulator [Bacteriovoracaceae bacterium]|nr:sigma-54-dependent Fis family transcriptional regulator [Bacteroidota bacterium]
MEQQNDSFNALFEITRTINSILEPGALLEKVLEIAMTHLSAERGFVMLSDNTSESGYTVVALKNFNSKKASNEFAASSSVVTSVLQSGEAVLTFDAMSDERFESSVSIIAQKILSIICIPLRAGERISGAVYLDSSKSRKAFTEEAVKFLTVFGSLAAIAIENAQRYTTLEKENTRLKHEVDVSHLFGNIIGKSEKWKKVLEISQRVLDVDAAVLITGESGTGKELIARAIHEHGTRKGEAFVAVNSSALPEHLMESELFGYVKGSFTGAAADKKGLVEVANGGTLFLDEIGELPLLLQSKILRLLQEKEYRRVGDTVNRKANIRIIAATNKELAEEVKGNRFREDLYFRLNVVGIHLPPLRERKDDIPLLANHFVRKAAENYKRPVEGIHPEAMQLLLANQWKGNVREFQNVIERAVVLCRETQLTKDDFLFDSKDQAVLQKTGMTLADFERQLIETTLEEMNGNRTRTAERLGVSLRWLQYRIKEWGNE